MGRGRGRLLARIKANAAIGAREEPAEETTVLSFPRGDMGRIIGKGGSTKKEIEEKCRAQVQVGWILMRGLVDLLSQVEELGEQCEVTIRGGARERERAANLVKDAVGGGSSFGGLQLACADRQD